MIYNLIQELNFILNEIYHKLLIIFLHDIVYCIIVGEALWLGREKYNSCKTQIYISKCFDVIMPLKQCENNRAVAVCIPGSLNQLLTVAIDIILCLMTGSVDMFEKSLNYLPLVDSAKSNHLRHPGSHKFTVLQRDTCQCSTFYRIIYILNLDVQE